MKIKVAGLVALSVLATSAFVSPTQAKPMGDRPTSGPSIVSQRTDRPAQTSQARRFGAPIKGCNYISVQNHQAVAAVPDTTNPDIVREAPPVDLPDNSQIPQSRLMSRDAILSKRVLPASARNVSLELTTMGRYFASLEGGGGDLQAVSQSRQVWILKDQYPEYEHLRLGLTRNAVVTSILDAETGQTIGTTIEGTPEGPVGPNSFIVTPTKGFLN